jgi:hypothetical protein
MSQNRTPIKTGGIKTGRASLIGGVAVGVASFLLWALITHELGIDTAPLLFCGLLVSAAVGLWIRVADL